MSGQIFGDFSQWGEMWLLTPIFLLWSCTYVKVWRTNTHIIYVLITQGTVWKTWHRLQGVEGEASSAKAAESQTPTAQRAQVEPIRKKHRQTNGWCENRTGSHAVWSQILRISQLALLWNCNFYLGLYLDAKRPFSFCCMFAQVNFVMLLNVLNLFCCSEVIVKFEWKMWHILHHLHLRNMRGINWKMKHLFWPVNYGSNKDSLLKHQQYSSSTKKKLLSRK